MNILYIGPYKNNNILYNSSEDIIYGINNNSKIKDLTIRPLYLYEYNVNSTNLILANLSSKKLKPYYDIIIQHAPIEMIVNPHSLCDKSVLIPLFSKILGSNEYYEKLQCSDEVYTDSIDFTELLNHRLKIDAKTFSYSGIYDNNNEAPAFSVYENTIKFYSIFQEYDEDIFYKTIHAFYQSFGNNDDISLIILFNSKNKNTIDTITEKFSEIKKFLGIKSNIFNVQIVIKEMSFEEINNIHKKCNIYIDIDITNKYSKINRYLAQQNAKKIIIEENLVSDIEIYEKDRNQYYPLTGVNSLSNLMIQTVSNDIDTKSFTKYPSISKLICP